MQKNSITSHLLQRFRSTPSLLQAHPKLQQNLVRAGSLSPDGRVLDWDSLQGYVKKKFKGRMDAPFQRFREMSDQAVRQMPGLDVRLVPRADQSRAGRLPTPFMPPAEVRRRARQTPAMEVPSIAFAANLATLRHELRHVEQDRPFLRSRAQRRRALTEYMLPPVASPPSSGERLSPELARQLENTPVNNRTWRESTLPKPTSATEARSRSRLIAERDANRTVVQKGGRPEMYDALVSALNYEEEALRARGTGELFPEELLPEKLLTEARGRIGDPLKRVKQIERSAALHRNQNRAHLDRWKAANPEAPRAELLAEAVRNRARVEQTYDYTSRGFKGGWDRNTREDYEYLDALKPAEREGISRYQSDMSSRLRANVDPQLADFYDELSGRFMRGHSAMMPPGRPKPT